ARSLCACLSNCAALPRLIEHLTRGKDLDYSKHWFSFHLCHAQRSVPSQPYRASLSALRSGTGQLQATWEIAPNLPVRQGTCFQHIEVRVVPLVRLLTIFMKTYVHGMTRLLPGILLAGSSFTVVAGGVRTPDQDAFATGRGEAFVATAD